METPSSSDAQRVPAPEGARPRKPRFRVEVKRVRRLTPRMVRVTFGGDALADFAWTGPASHVKLIFAQDGAPDVNARPTMRTYTPRRFDRASREIEVDFVIHGEGPACAWAQQATVGQALTVAGPGRSYSVDASADWYLLAGDDTAIAAVSTILESLPPAVPAIVLLEVVDDAERHVIDARTERTEIRWLTRGPDPRNAGRRLEAAVRAIELPPGSGRIYVACESDAMRRIRRHLLTERGFPREGLVTRGYWRLGETDHPDRDYGEDAG